MRFAWLFLVIAAGGCARSYPGSAAAASPPGTSEAVVRKGVFEQRLLLSGEVDAVSAVELKVPRVSNGRVTVRWMVTDGAQVKAGDKVAELDNASYVSLLKERVIVISQQEMDLKRQQWKNALAETDRQMEVARKKAALKRAEVDADIPDGILPKRDYLEKQLALKRIRLDLEKAEEGLKSQLRSDEMDLSVDKLGLEKAHREMQMLEGMVEALILKAPQDGTIIAGDHFNEGRKLQLGDEVFVGQTVVRMPDLKQIRVRAWLADVDDGKVAVGMPAEIVLDAFPDRPLKGKVQEIAPVAREVTDRSQRRVFRVAVHVEDDGAAGLQPGMSSRVAIVTERKPDQVLVPRMALDRSSKDVVVRLASGKTQPVTLGPCNTHECVATGIEPGTSVRGVGP